MKSFNNKKSVYIETKTLKGIMFPNTKGMANDKLVPVSGSADIYLNKIFSSKLYYFDHTKFDPVYDDISNQFTPLVIKVILTTESRSGVYLLYEDISGGKVSIPGGHVDQEDIQYVKETYDDDELFGRRILGEALAREIFEEFYRESGESMYEATKMTVPTFEKICQALSSKLILSSGIDAGTQLYYLYRRQDSLTFYYVVDCTLYTVGNSVSKIPRNLIYLDKELYKISRRRRTLVEKEDILGDVMTSNPIHDIRFSDKYSPILDAIFNTSDLF